MVDQHVRAPTGSAPAERTILGAGTPGAAEVPTAPPPHNEGRTVAAWTTVAIVVVGAIVAGLGVAVARPALGWAGGGVAVVGLVVGGVLRSLGYGQRAARAR